MYSLFDQHIERFNEMYSLPCGQRPNYLGDARIEDFYKILSDELEEVDDIYAIDHPSEKLVALADWLGDIIVYCASEAKRHGITIGPIVEAIMESNFTKLGLDGKPIINAMGKVEKGPNYRKPEPEIERILFGSRDAEI